MRRAIQKRAKLFAVALMPTVAALWTSSALAQTLTWDASGANPAAPTDGSGNWNTTTDANWSNGVSDSAWVNGDVAASGVSTLTLAGPAAINVAAGVGPTISAPVAGGAGLALAGAGGTLNLAGN